MFLKEQTNLIDKHYNMLKELGYWQEYSDLYKRGFNVQYESKPYIVFTTGNSDLVIHQNLFTGKFVFLDEFKEIPINEISVEKLKDFILKKFEENYEMYWRNERNK